MFIWDILSIYKKLVLTYWLSFVSDSRRSPWAGFDPLPTYKMETGFQPSDIGVSHVTTFPQNQSPVMAPIHNLGKFNMPLFSTDICDFVYFLFDVKNALS